MTNAPIIIVIGTVGSGKGTQVALISKEYDIPSVSAGDLFRNEAAKPTELGKRVDKILRSGGLMTIDLWKEVVGAYIDHTNFSKGYILDGVLRSLEQVAAFNALIKEKQLPEPWALEIRLDEDIAMERLMKRGRQDTDSVEATKARLEWSRTQTQPVIDQFRELGRLVSVDGDQTIEKVHADIIEELIKAKVLSETDETH